MYYELHSPVQVLHKASQPLDLVHDDNDQDERNIRDFHRRYHHHHHHHSLRRCLLRNIAANQAGETDKKTDSFSLYTTEPLYGRSLALQHSPAHGDYYNFCVDDGRSGG